MVEDELSSAGGPDNLEQARDVVGRSLGEQTSSKAPEGGVQVRQAVLEPPPGNPARVVRALFLGGPDEERQHRTAGPDGGGQGWVVLHPEIPTEPDDGDAFTHPETLIGD